LSVLEELRPRAHLLLGAIRLFNGTAALLAPTRSARRLGVDPDANGTTVYPLRMFGVRTVVLGAELLIGDEETRARSMRTGIPIHASDTAAAAIAGFRRQLPAATAAQLVAVSALNTSLAVIGSLPEPRPRWRRLLGR
jgi:hypothetical protein